MGQKFAKNNNQKNIIKKTTPDISKYVVNNIIEPNNTVVQNNIIKPNNITEQYNYSDVVKCIDLDYLIDSLDSNDKNNIHNINNDIYNGIHCNINTQKFKYNTKSWTPSEDQQLLQNINKYTIIELAKKHNRTIRAIQLRINHIVLKLYDDEYSLDKIYEITRIPVKNIENILWMNVTSRMLKDVNMPKLIPNPLIKKYLEEEHNLEYNLCHKCGRKGHYASFCIAKKHITGYYIYI